MLRLPQPPDDKYFVHRFPRDMPPGDTLSVTIGGIKKGLLDTAGLIIKPIKEPRQKRLERFTDVEMEFGQMVIAHELRVNLTTAEILVVGRIHSPLFLHSQVLTPRKSTLTTYYQRKGKNKLLHAYFQDVGHAFISIDRVFELYDRVYCVDTNTSTNQSGRKVAVTTALTVTSSRVGENAVHVGSDHTIQLVTNEPPPGNPELHGIWSMLGFLWKNHPNLLQGRLAIITDTDLGKVKAWNERTEPFYDGHGLPDGVDIFYASADAGSEEFMPNRLMKACDSLCTQKLREVLAD